MNTGRLALVGGGDSESVLENAGAGSCKHVAVLPQSGYSLLQGSSACATDELDLISHLRSLTLLR